MRLFFILFSFFFFIKSLAQSGCTDPFAANYNPLAVENDGSCVYDQTNYSTTLISTLPTVISESSALIFCENTLLSLNDSGGERVLFKLDTLGQLIQTITVANANNLDWEALAISDSTLFIGDFGNNNGNRQNLSIYSIPIAQIESGADTVQSEKRHFVYQDQQSFTSAPNATNFDAEAFVYYQDSLHIFSKSWQSFSCKHYVLPSIWQDTATAELRDSLYINGLVTDATIDKETGRIVLLGYKLDAPTEGGAFYFTFAHILFDYPNHLFFKGNNRRIELGGVLSLGQTEGITWSSQNKGFITSEKVTTPIEIAPKLRSFNFSAFFHQEQANTIENETKPYYFLDQTGNLEISPSVYQPKLYNILGQELPLVKTSKGWKLKYAQSGNYFLFIGNQTYRILIP
jgi:hypothetical protein